MSDSATRWAIKARKVRKHLTPVSTIKQEGSTEGCKEVTMNTSDALTDFVEHSQHWLQRRQHSKRWQISMQARRVKH